MLTGSKHRSGNVIFMLMIAVVLIAALTYAISKSESSITNLTREKATIAAAQVSSFYMNLKRATENMTRQGKSESTISFASRNLTGYGTPDTAADNEVFNIRGGGVGFLTIPANVNNDAQWEFFSYTAAPGVGNDDTPDLMVVLPNVKENFCRAYNDKAGYSVTAPIPTDDSACIYDTTKRFNGSFATGGDVNTMNANTFRVPAPFACVACADGSYHAYYVLLAR